MTAARLDEQLDHHVKFDNLADDKKQLEKKYTDLKADVNKMLEDSLKQVQMANYEKFKEEEDREQSKYEAKEKAKVAEQKVQEMVLENKKLKEEMFVLKEVLDELEKKRHIEKEAWKGEKKKLETALYDLFEAHNGKKEQLKKIQQILNESQM